MSGAYELHESCLQFHVSDYEYSEEPVVVSGRLVTRCAHSLVLCDALLPMKLRCSRGPGTAFPFALTLVELLCGAEKRKEVAGPMVFPPGTFA